MYKTILVPVDIAHVVEGRANLDLAAQHAADGAKIILLNVIEDIPGWAAAELPADLIKNSQSSSREKLEKLASSSGMEMDVEVRTGHSYHTILQVAEEKKADLIIVASHRPGLQDYFLGSTAAKVVRHAKCSVLVIR
jgi:universal stress protein F